MITRRRQRALQAGLLALGAGALLAGAWRGKGRLPKAEELISSACVLGAALVARFTQRRTDGLLDLVGAGMACGLGGDLVMGRVVPLPDRLYVPAGMLVFGAGHLVYIRAFHALPRTPAAPTAGRLVLAAYLLFTVFAWQRWLRNDRQAPLSYAALLYGLLLAAMAATAGEVALGRPSRPALALGAALFVASDLILGARLLRKIEFPYRDELIWLSYISGQALIVWSASDEAQGTSDAGQA